MLTREPLGLAIFISFSQRSPKYDRKACEIVYNGGDGRVTIQSLVQWAEQDSPKMVDELLPANLQGDQLRDVNPGMKDGVDFRFDHLLVLKWAASFQSTYPGGRPKKDEEAGREFDTAMDGFFDDIALYMNNFLALCHQDAIIETYDWSSRTVVDLPY